MNLQQARKIAVETCYELDPHCQKGFLRITGSIRREKPEPKDIEIVALPNLAQSTQNSLFDIAPTEKIYCPGFIDTVKLIGTITKGSPDNGKYLVIELHQSIKLDLFLPDDFDFYRQFAIRTGSGDYSGKVIASAWRKKGWCGSDKGLRKISDCIETKDKQGKSKWKCINPSAELPPHWESEEAFFEWIGVEWVHPKERNINFYKTLTS